MNMRSFHIFGQTMGVLEMNANTIHPGTLMILFILIVFLLSIGFFLVLRGVRVPESTAGRLSYAGWTSVFSFFLGALLMYLAAATSPLHAMNKNTGVYLGTISRPEAPTGKVQLVKPGEFHLDPLDSGQRWVVYHDGSARNGKYVSDTTYSPATSDHVRAVAFYIQYPNGEYTNPVLLCVN